MRGKKLVDAFKEFMRNVPQPVFIAISKDSDGELGGLTVSSFTSISLDPLLVMVAIDKNARSFIHFKYSTGWTVSLLGEKQSLISGTFANPRISMEERFERVKLGYSPNLKVPYIKDAVAFMECEPYDSFEAGDHFIFLGKVVHAEILSGEKPLIYHRKHYTTVKD